MSVLTFPSSSRRQNNGWERALPVFLRITGVLFAVAIVLFAFDNKKSGDFFWASATTASISLLCWLLKPTRVKEVQRPVAGYSHPVQIGERREIICGHVVFMKGPRVVGIYDPRSCKRVSVDDTVFFRADTGEEREGVISSIDEPALYREDVLLTVDIRSGRFERVRLSQLVL